MKQDPVYLGNSSILSHVNLAKTTGWYFDLGLWNGKPHVQFSVTNTDGKIFTVSCPVDAGIFENIVGTFDGKIVKIYVNGSLKGIIPFVGTYNPEINMSLNAGFNPYGVRWNGVIDELRLYNRSISDEEIHKLTDYSIYLKSSHFSSKDQGLLAYWSFDNGTQDMTAYHNNGNIVHPSVSMVFSPRW